MSIAASLRTGPFIEDEESLDKLSNCKGILKFKENILRHKCNKSLKKKLKKYKLRKDGEEDPQVIEISQSFHQNLRLRSPSSQIVNAKDNLESDEIIYSKNYIIKMVRRKQALQCENERKHKEQNSKSSETFKQNVEENKNLEKKETNAFKILMDSRNKIIGSNSPGKEREVNEPEIEENNQKKIIKVKRNLALQKLAEAKGSLRKKQIEEQQEKYINQKMVKRAERLKNMVTKCNKNQNIKKIYASAIVENEIISTVSAIKKNDFMSNVNSEGSKIIIETNNDKRKNTHSNYEKKVTPHKSPKVIACDKMEKKEQDEEDFLSKLSPSLKKKENMLCYFKKIDKDPDPLYILDNDLTEEKTTTQTMVKDKEKNKKITKRKKLSLLKTNGEVMDCNETNKTAIVDLTDIVKMKPNPEDTRNRKRKRKHILHLNNESNVLKNIVSDVPANVTESRPKRNVKKPVKYIDDVLLSSSDEELHIGTPKKKKHIGSKLEPNDAYKSKNSMNQMVSLKENFRTPNRNLNLKKSIDKDSTKLAPLFVGKSIVDVAALEAKQKFLQSGIPDQLKKVISQQKNQIVIANSFYAVVHVQQNDYSLLSSSSPKSFELFEIESPSKDYESNNDIYIKNMLSLTHTVIQQNKDKSLCEQNDIRSTLQHIKESYPDFPVYRTYKTLHSKSKSYNKDFNCIDLNNSSDILNNSIETKTCNPDNLCWTDKYKASSTKHIIGNFESNSELKKWLVTWTENYTSPKNCNEDSDSDFRNSDGDSRDSERISNNLLILTGPAGSGKTASVYAVSSELGIKVIEVNVSSKRTGKILLQDLQEATQSHKVNRGKSSSAENSQNSQEFIKSSIKPKKNLKIKLKTCDNLFSQKSDSLPQKSQEDNGTAMSLILIDDADIVFDQDDGFFSAIAQLVQCSKRPVILVTTSLSSPHLQKFMLSGNIIKMNPLSPKMLGTWLDIMCLTDTGMCWPGTGAKFLNFFKGDMRKTINCLQFYTFTEAQKSSETIKLKNNENRLKVIDCEDENSNISWGDQDSSEAKNDVGLKNNLQVQNGIWFNFIGNPNNNRYLEYPIDLFNVWWKVSDLMKADIEREKESNIETVNTVSYKRLEDISDVLDNISFADCMSYNVRPDTKSSISSNPWYCSESDSVSERESFDDVTNFYEESNNISHLLVKRSIAKFKNFGDAHTLFPGLLEQRKRDRIISRHETLSSVVNPHLILDRRAVALDYWSTCRSICRIEKSRTDNNSKRNNRFFHYLKSSKLMCKNDVFDKLCDSLKPCEESDRNQF